MQLKDKTNLIEKIDDEVRVLHPLLENIFPKLPNVKSYEYTHGQFERGADFVLQIENATTKRVNYVGVVVKCGKVGGSKVAEIEEQIKECSEERKYQILNKVRCNEVWVFTTGGYTERAKEKITERLSGQKIEFFGTEDLASYVDEYSPYFWHQLPEALGSYLQDLSRKLTVFDTSSNISLVASDIYIELDCYEKITNKYMRASSKSHELKNVNFFEEILRTKLGLLEAEMGFGKSKLTRRLAMHLCTPESYTKHHIIPIYSSFKSFAEACNLDLKLFVEKTLGEVAILLSKNDAKVLVILDGLDEYSTAENTSSDLIKSLSEQIKSLEQFNLLITTRPIKTLTDKATLYESSRVFGIRPLSLNKIVNYVQQTCTKNNLPSRLFEDLKKSQLFKQLPHSPIAAALFSNLLTQGQQEVPQSLTELYSKSTELMLGRWDQKKELTTEKQFKTAYTIAEVLACYFVENSLIYVSRAEIRQMIKDYLSKRNTGIDEREITSILLERSNLLGKVDETDTIMFRHRSFAEYLCASKKAKDQSLNIKETALNPYWSNVLFFYTGTLQDCAGILDEITQLEPENELEQWVKIISVPNCLLSAYLTEFGVVEKSLYQVIIDSAKLLVKVKSGNSLTRLTELSVMQLVYIFKSMITESIAYDYFSKCFDDLAIKLYESDLDIELKSYALLLLGSAALECNNQEPFKFLIESIGATNLPLPVSLAIRCELESKTNLTNSKLLKLHKDRLNKVFKITGAASKAKVIDQEARFKQLFEQPIKKKGRLINT